MKKIENDYERYLKIKDNARERIARASAAGRDIGELPEVVDAERKAACRDNLKLFCETYFAEIFPLAWSPDHLRVIEKIETAVLRGGLFALAMPRGSGKSSLAECAAIWAALYGHRYFVVLVGATETAAMEILESIKTTFETNETLAADFPEVIYPILKLEGIANRCAGQVYRGVRTRIGWTSNEIILPTIAGSVVGGVVLKVAGITGRIRGMKSKRADGVSIRPNLVIIDDPQTNESANSIEQNRKRVRVLSGDILGLAGPGQTISGIMPCTVICPDDMADQILDKKKHPDWNGERTKLLYQEPANEKLWEQYAEIRAESLRIFGDIHEATEFYAEHRAEMDAGAVVAWEARYNRDELSALQHAMNLKLRDPEAFAAEYQNEPLREEATEREQLNLAHLTGQLNGMKQNEVPVTCNTLSMFVDIHKNVLFYTLLAWDEKFSGYIIDYGTFPDQHSWSFTLTAARYTLDMLYPDSGLEERIFTGLNELLRMQFQREFTRADGALLKINRCMIDANWGQSTDIIYDVCRRSEFAALLYPSHGKYIGPANKPFAEYRKQPGDRIGLNWMIPNVAGKRAIRHVIFDTNWWKSFVAERLQMRLGAPGCISVWGRDPRRHELLFQHCCAEYFTPTAGRGRVVNEWKTRPGTMDNHWWDCLIGCAIAANIEGIHLAGFTPEKKKRKRVFIELPK